MAGENKKSPDEAVPLGTAAQLQAYLFGEDDRHRPWTRHTHVLGQLLVWRLEEREAGLAIAHAHQREVEGLTATLPAGIRPDEYLDLVDGLLRQCMDGNLDEFTRGAVPDSKDVVRLGPAAYPSYRMEAQVWAAAFGEDFLRQVQAAQ